MSHIHFATICGARSYGSSSNLLHGFGVVRRLAFRVRDQWSLFSSEVHAKLTRSVTAFFVQTSMFCLGVCTCRTLQFEDSKGHWWCNPVLFILISSKICHFGHRILHRFWTTLQGSREDIGWLQRTQASLCSVDGTGRFKEILREIRWFFFETNQDEELPNVREETLTGQYNKATTTPKGRTTTTTNN
jgi:ribosome biogenesis protein UTP30